MSEIVTYSNPTSLQPHDLGEAMTLAKALAASSIVPSALRGKHADILVIMMYGMELGLSVNQAMRGINVIKGRPSLSTELRVSKTRERGHRVGVVCVICGEWADHSLHRRTATQAAAIHQFEADWTRERCTVKAVRADTGEASVITWTVEDALAAGLLREGKGDLAGKLIARSDKGEVLPWEAYTRDMLYNRAADRACKQIAPEVAYGLYTTEEVEGMADEAPRRVTAEVGEQPDVNDLIGRPESAAEAVSPDDRDVDAYEGVHPEADQVDWPPVAGVPDGES